MRRQCVAPTGVGCLAHPVAVVGSCEALSSQNGHGSPADGFVRDRVRGAVRRQCVAPTGWAAWRIPLSWWVAARHWPRRMCVVRPVAPVLRTLLRRSVRRQCVAPTGWAARCIALPWWVAARHWPRRMCVVRPGAPVRAGSCAGARARPVRGRCLAPTGCSGQGAHTAYFEGSGRVWRPRFRLTPAHHVEFGGTVIATVRSFYEHYRVPADLLRGRP